MKTSRTSAKLRAQVSMAWWWPYYTGTLIAFCRVFGRLPNEERLAYWAKRAVRITMVRTDAQDSNDA